MTVPTADRIPLGYSDVPQWVKARDGSRFVTVGIHPLTTDDLIKRCHEFGQAAMLELEWSCVLVWLMNAPDAADLRTPMSVAISAVSIVSEASRVRSGWPRHDGTEWSRPRFDYLSPYGQKLAEQFAAETLEDWERVGKPHLGRSSIKRTYQHLISSPPFYSKYVRPMDDNEENK